MMTLKSNPKKNTKIGIKFCGNCNPHINPMKIYEEIKKKLPPHISIVDKDSGEMDFLIVLSSCPIDCSSRPEGNYEEILIAGETLNRYSCQADKLPGKIIDFINQHSLN